MDSRESFYVIIDACISGDLETVRKSIKDGISPRVTDQSGNDCVSLSIENGHLDVLKCLIEDGNLTIDYLSERLPIACRLGHFNIVEYMLDQGCNFNIPGRHYLSSMGSACYSGNLNVIKILINRGLIMSYDDIVDHFYSACSVGHLEVVKFLVEKYPELKDCIKIEYSGEMTQETVIEEEEEEEEEEEYYSNMISISRACGSGNLELVKYLIDIGADPCVTPEIAHICLCEACSSGNINIVKLLKEKGVSFITDNVDYYTPLEKACSGSSNLEIVKYLLENGVDPNSRNCEGLTALQCSSEMNESLEYLIVECYADYSDMTYEIDNHILEKLKCKKASTRIKSTKKKFNLGSKYKESIDSLILYTNCIPFRSISGYTISSLLIIF